MIKDFVNGANNAVQIANAVLRTISKYKGLAFSATEISEL